MLVILINVVNAHIATRFGAVLDMVTDRSATACLMVNLATMFPKAIFIIQVLLALDFSSHYMQMVSTLSTGLQSHKATRTDSHWLLRLYYTNRLVLFVVCLGNEMFFLLAYVYHFTGLSNLLAAAFILITPIFLFKQVCNVIQLVDASLVLVNVDRIEHEKRE